MMKNGADYDLLTRVAGKTMNISPDINVHTCVIGKRATQAKYFISDPSYVVNILE